MARKDKGQEEEGFSTLGEALERTVPRSWSKAPKPPSRTQLRLIEAACELEIGESRSPTYQHSVLCQTSMPYRRTSERVIERRNGRTALRIEAGTAYHEDKDEWVDLPMPFGPKARLVLIHLNTAAILTQSNVIDVGDSMTAFFTRIVAGRRDKAIALNGREVRTMKEQISALSAAEIRFAIGGTSKKQGKVPVVTDFDLWFPKESNQRVFWPSTVTLSLDYFESLVNHAVPLDPVAVGALAHSAMGLDVYAWLAQRLCRIPSEVEALVPWVSLHEQFGSNYKAIRQFRAAFLKALKQVLIAYPNALVRPSGKGLHLKLSPPPITRKKLKQIS